MDGLLSMQYSPHYLGQNWYFLPHQCWFLGVGMSEAKKSTLEWKGRMEGAQLFVGIWVQHGVSQLNVVRIVGFMLIVVGKITEPWALSDSPIDTTYK